jgi:aminoglycoside phosphotransferase (APT) family kinase protein
MVDEPERERRHPVVEIDCAAATELLARVPGIGPLRALSLLAGGHINSNYLATVAGGRRLVLRLFAGGLDAFRKETCLVRGLAATVPVPRLLFACDRSPLLELPYSVLEYVDAVSLPLALGRWPKETEGIACALARPMLALARHNGLPFPTVVWNESIIRSIDEGDGARWLGAETTRRLLAFAQAQSSLIEGRRGRDCLVHGDFQGDNILLERVSSHWAVAAVLDWEWARRGPQMQDLGSLLRHPGATASAFAQGLSEGFDRQGAPLPGDWIRTARLWDLVAVCEKLAFPRHRGAVTRRAISVIERCLADYGE